MVMESVTCHTLILISQRRLALEHKLIKFIKELPESYQILGHNLCMSCINFSFSLMFVCSLVLESVISHNLASDAWQDL